ncbi:MAG: YhcN/YlaJ family sporulation lipoprotein [Clostridia bacterium]|nr:YhcN/YlaJ family sporulation lipoprotein [Clostridia bacterium]
MKKIILLLLLAMAGAMLLTGCASNADTLPSPTPGTGNNMLSPLTPAATGSIENPIQNPGTTTMPESTAQPLGNTVEGAQKAAQAMKEAVVKLSEVDEAWAVPMGDTALVGVKFNTQYQGGADDRLKKMVLARVQSVDKAITKVAVTDNAALVTGIQTLAETLKGASSLDDVNTKAEDMLKQLTVYSE